MQCHKKPGTTEYHSHFKAFLQTNTAPFSQQRIYRWEIDKVNDVHEGYFPVY